jgi:Spy/CpxP family protein refolding chaperone
MRIRSFLAAIALAAALVPPAFADAPLHKSLSLNNEQAQRVDAIQGQHRKTFAAKRQEHNREARKLRRAQIAHDSAGIAQQQTIVAGLRDELRKIRDSENEAIRALLTPEQQQKFEKVLEQRRAMHGPSRDERLLEEG